MYPAPVAALIGELFGKNRWSLIATSLIAPAAWFAAKAYLSTVVHEGIAVGTTLSTTVGFLLMIVLALQLAAIFAYVDLTAGSKSSGFPRHILLLPAPTWLLALVPIIAGAMFISGFVLVWMRYVSGVELDWTQQLTIATGITALMCWVQAMSWELLPPRWLRIVVMVLVVVCAILSALSVLAKEPHFLLGKSGGALGLSMTTLGGFSFAYLAVVRSRRGETLDLGAHLRRLVFPFGRFSRKATVPDLPSGIGAQDWYEWRLYGRFLPMFMLVVCAGPVASIAFAGPRKAPSIILAAMTFVVFFVFSPMMGAAYISKNLTRRVQTGSFDATRPLSDLEIALAKLRLALKSHLLSLAIVFTAIAVLIAASRNNAILIGLWSQLVAQQGVMDAYLALLLVLVVAIATSWAVSAYFMSLQLFGECVDKKRHGWKISLGVVILFFVLLDVIARLYKARSSTLVWLQSAHFELMIPAVVLLAFGLGLLPRFRISSSPGALKRLAGGLLGAAALCLIGIWQLNLSFGYQWALSCLVIAVALLTFLPFLLMPVLVGLNRHR